MNDNSWTSGETRRLTPDQNTEATRACPDIQEEGERVILPAMQRIEAADPDRRLAGLEHMCKGADRLKEKLVERLRYHPDLPPRQAGYRIGLRGSVSHAREKLRTTRSSMTTRPGTSPVLCRLTDAERRGESFGRDLEWKFSSLLHAAERGDTEYDLIPITEAQASPIIARIRDARPAE